MLDSTSRHSMGAAQALAPVGQPIVRDVWRDKYRWGDEATPEDTCSRVADALTQGESEEFRAEVTRALCDREICLGGRILAGAGTPKRVTWINCYVLDTIQDSMATEPDRPGLGIMDALSAASYTQQMGGGIGQDFSTVRPRGALVQRTQSVSSGVLPFMDMWDSMCATIRSAGARRGAMMATLRCDHPDILEFIEAKQQPGRLSNFNVSVTVTDEFVAALERGDDWDLGFHVPRADGEHVTSYHRMWTVRTPGGTRYCMGSTSDPEWYVYRRMPARELWDAIVGSTYIHAEPGIIFIDRVNAQNNLGYCEEIAASNPCGEQFLPPNGACNLGHINLAAMVRNPFTSEARFDEPRIQAAAMMMVRLLDNVLDLTQYPTEAQRDEALAKRRVGLGFTGLATALQQLGVAYGSPAAVDLTRHVSRTIALAAYQASLELAKERGPFPALDTEALLAEPFLQKLPIGLRGQIMARGLRNGVLLSVAPTGTTSLFLGNVSSGIEPVFDHEYPRRVRDADGEMTTEYQVYDYGYLEYHKHLGRQAGHDVQPGTVELPAHFVTASDLTVDQHVRMAAAAQEWVDSAISKTINCPTSMSFEDFKEVYTLAYSLGLKGCTTYRPDPRSQRGSVLGSATVAEVSGGSAQGAAPGSVEEQVEAFRVPMRDVAEGRRYRVRWPQEDCSYYITITDYVDEAGRRRPFEIFINTKSARHDEWIKALTLMITAVFRRGGDVSFVTGELRQVFSATGGAWMGGRYVPSLVAAIAERIEDHFRWLGMLGGEDRPLSAAPPESASAPEAAVLADVCGRCGARAVLYEEGCGSCRACGHSDCG